MTVTAVPSAPDDLSLLEHRVLNLRAVAYAISTVGAAVVALVSGSERAILLAILAGAVLVATVTFRTWVGSRLDVCLAIDTVGAGTLWWLFGPVAAVDFVLFYVVATAALLLPRVVALRITGSLLLITLAQLVLHLPAIAPNLPWFHADNESGTIEEILSRAILIIGAAVMLFTISRLLQRSQRATSESEQRFRSLVEASPDAFLVHNESAILFANPAAADLILALRPDDLVGIPIDTFVHPDSLELIRRRTDDVLEGRTSPITPLKLIRRDGTVIHAEYLAIPTTYETQPAAQVVLRDITERHLAHRALQESEERYKSFFEGIPTPMYRTTPDGRILDANAALVSLLGYPDKKSLLELEVYEAYVRPGDRSDSQELLHRQGLLENYEQELIRYDGSHIWVRDTSRIVSGQDGEIVYYEGAMVDITERKRAEGTNRRLIRILEATPDFVAIADEAGTFLYANQAARDFAGVTDDAEVRSLKVVDVLGVEGEGTLAEILQADIWNGLLTLRSPAGSVVPASTVVINHRDAEGNIEYFSAVARDVSEQLAAEQRLEQLVRSKDDFVASVSHELRTPLTAVVGLTQELRDAWVEFSADEISEFVSLIAEQSTEVANIVDDLLVAARADIGRIAITREETNVGEQVTAVLTALSMEGNTNISFSAPDGVLALADATRLRQIIRNLLTNAVRYGGRGIDLEVLSRNGSVVVTVTDDGPGIPEERRESIFEPYERAHTANSQPASVGLGLTVSRQLARLMGGDLIYRSGARGSSFELSLPAFEAKA